MNKLTKRLLSLAVVVVMVMAMMPTVFAEEPAYTDWDGSASAIVDGAYLKLTATKQIEAEYSIDGIAVTIDLNGNAIESQADTRAFYVKNGGSLTLKNGSVTMPGLSASSGGIIYVEKSAFNMDNVVVTKKDFTATNTTNGGIMYVINSTSNVEIKNSTLQWDATSTGFVKQGGSIYVTSGAKLTVRDTTISGGSSTYGAGIFATSSNTKVELHNTTINSGAAYRGCGLYIGNKNVVTDIYAGTVITNGTFVKGTSDNLGQAVYMQGTLTVHGGTLGDIHKGTGTLSVASGVNFYNNPFLKGLEGFDAYVMDKTTGTTLYTVYTKLADALAAAKDTNTVSLMRDVTAGEVLVPAGVTLNLYNHVLTADAVTATAAGAQIKDEKSSKNADGKLICNNVVVSGDNDAAPIYYEGAYHFQKIKFAEKLEGNVYKFYMSDALDTIYLDEVWAEGYGNSGLKLEICASYKVNGEAKEKTFDVSDELIKLYAADWENKMFVLTITSDMSNITDLVFTARVAVA